MLQTLAANGKVGCMDGVRACQGENKFWEHVDEGCKTCMFMFVWAAGRHMFSRYAASWACNFWTLPEGGTCGWMTR